MPKFDIDVQLTGKDGNAFIVLGAVLSALKKAGATAREMSEFQDEAMKGDYDNLLQTCMRWVNVH